MGEDPQSTKNTVKSSVFLPLLGSALVKAACKTSMKLTPDAHISKFQLELDQPSDVVLTLVETGKFEYLGQVSIGLKLVPKSSAESPTSSASGKEIFSTSGSNNTE